MNRNMISSILLSLILTACFAGAAFAVPATFFGEDLGLGETTPLPFWPLSANAESAFLGNLIGSIGTETFESTAAGTVAPLPVTFTGSGVVATLSGDGFVANVTPGTTNGVGRYAISGSQYWDSSSDFSIQFSEPVAAFGFYGVDIGDFNGQVTLTLESGGTVDLVIPNTTNGLGGSVIFFGFVDTEQSYTAITLGNTAPGVDFFGFDNMTIATGAEVLVGACCLEAFQCMVVSSGECSQVGNGIDDSFYMGGGTDCVGTCDNVVAIEESSWGSLKSLYR
jgi:hypothetical protein